MFIDKAFDEITKKNNLAIGFDLGNDYSQISYCRTDQSIPDTFSLVMGEEQYNILTSELVIDGYKIRPVTVNVAESDESGTVLKMTLYEGRNRQIRKMCEAAGLTVKRLSRISIGNLKLNNLPVGKWRFLEKEEVDYLYKATGKNR